MAKSAGKNGQKPQKWKWTAQRERAALLVSQDELTNQAIAEVVGVARQSLDAWKANPTFDARVEEHTADARRRIRSSGIAVVENRLRQLQDRHDRMRRVIDERGADPEMEGVPGGKTGLLVHNVKAIGAGPLAERVDLYEVDTGLLKELREHEKQVAQELGQWTEKHDHSGQLDIRPELQLLTNALRDPETAELAIALGERLALKSGAAGESSN